MDRTFLEFVKKKKRESVKQLNTVKKVLENQGYSVDSHLDDEDDPYIFLKGKGSLSFDGVRIYKIGDSIAYRIQKESTTHPYGRAYLLDIEGTYNDLMAETGNEEKAGKQVIETIKKEFDKFFQKSVAAERDLKTADFEDEGKPDAGGILVKSLSTDYATSIGSRIG